MKIESETRHDRFVLDERNRNVNTGKVTRLKEALKKKNLLSVFPLVVRKDGGKLVILDGQHRYTAARELGLRVYYTTTTKMSIEDVANVNMQQSKWKARDYVESYATQGKEAYVTLLEFHNRTRLSMTVCAGLLSGDFTFGVGGLPQKKLAGGDLEVKDKRIAEEIYDHICEFDSLCDFSRSRSFVAAIAKAMMCPSYNPREMVRKAKVFGRRWRRYGSVEDNLNMIEEAYNYRRSGYISIKAEVVST